jgi:polyisoprenoid-binding protein YceI
MLLSAAGPPWIASIRSTLLAVLVCASGREVHAADTIYALDMARSSIVIHVGKAGLFSFAGHEHVVTAQRLEGEILAAADDLSRSRVTLTFATAGLRVEEQGEPAGDAAKVQEAMVGPRVLDATRLPTVTFRSKIVTGKGSSSGVYDLNITGDLSLHGVTRSLVVPLRVEVSGDELKASGHLVLRQTDYGINPVSVAGVVKVKDEIAIDYTFVATKVLH